MLVLHTVQTHDLFIVIPAAQACIHRIGTLGTDATARTVAVDIYYKAETDTALLAVRLDARAATQTLLDRLREEVSNAGMASLEPACLTAEDRSRFYHEHLASYSWHSVGFPTVADAARRLAGDLGLDSSLPVTATSPNVQVRFRSGQQWELGRARTLTREGMYVYADAPVRPGELVALHLQAGALVLAVQSLVVHVTDDDAAAIVGGAGFGARFLLQNAEDRRALEGLVVAGRRDGLGTLRAAPARREARYRVRWPVMVGDAPPVAALDVSHHGMFVATLAPIAGDQVEVRVASDDEAGNIRGNCRIARALSGPAAHARGVTAGYGLEVCAFYPGDEDRFHGFVNRVGARARRRLLVAASESRLRNLVLPLSAAGYVVAGASDPAELAAHAEATPPDLVLLDPSLPVSPRRLGKNLVCYKVDHNQSGKELRSFADAALLG